MRILVTGATGTVGSLAAAALLDAGHDLLLPVRGPRERAAVLERVRLERADPGAPLDVGRVRVVPFDPAVGLADAREALVEAAPRAVFHCAGSVSYFNRDLLDAANLELTRVLLDLARGLELERFVFVSSAFSCGYVVGVVPEALHVEPAEDPTEYTRTKRAAERLVAEAGLPHVILRPSVVIGHSRTGAYRGKPYGLYQLWGAYERLLCRSYQPTLHLVAPRTPVPLLHQDALQAVVPASLDLPTGAIVHLVSDERTLPTVRDLWELWCERVARPREVHYVDDPADLPEGGLSRAEEAWHRMTAVNNAIVSRRWRFETATLDALRRRGLPFPDATLASVATCLEAFCAGSARIQRFLTEVRPSA